MFKYLLFSNPRHSAGGPFLTPGPPFEHLVKEHYAMQHTKFQASEPSGSDEEHFSMFSMYFYGSNPGPLGAGPFWTRG